MIEVETCIIVYLVAMLLAGAAGTAYYWYRYRQAIFLASRGYKAESRASWGLFVEGKYWLWYPRDTRERYRFSIGDAYRREKLVAEKERLRIPIEPAPQAGSYQPGDFAKPDSERGGA